MTQIERRWKTVLSAPHLRHLRMVLRESRYTETVSTNESGGGTRAPFFCRNSSSEVCGETEGFQLVRELTVESRYGVVSVRGGDGDDRGIR
jgi:hypothetical protein